MSFSADSILNRQFLAIQLSRLSLPAAVTVRPSASLIEVLDHFTSHKFGAVLVTDDSNAIRGIITERDLVRETGLEEPSGRNVPVSGLMKFPVETIRGSASLAKAFHYMAIGHYRHLPVIGSGGVPFRMASIKDLIDYLHKHLTKKILNDSDAVIFDPNGVDEFFGSCVDLLPLDPALLVSEENPVGVALARMREGRQGAVVVPNQQGTLAGIFTERDYIMKVLGKDLSASKTAVGAVMTRAPRTLLSSSTTAFAFELLSDGGFRHLPVVDDFEKVVGVISVRSILNYLADAIVAALAQSSR